MALLTLKILNLLQYFGVRSKSYYHTEAVSNYDPAQPLKYYLDHTPRADYAGPFSANGVPMYTCRGKTDHLPVHIALIALGHADLLLRRNETRDRAVLLACANWFVKRQTPDGYWLTPYDMKKFNLKAPFGSAMSQGMGISVLVRAHLVQPDDAFITSARAALAPFRILVENGGVRTETGGRIFFEEYPTARPHHVLNGFIYAMWGLYDLMRLEQNIYAHRCWDEGLATLIEWLPRFDSGRWSWYHIGEGTKNPATIPYHKLHIEQLRALYAITGETIFEATATRWESYLNGRFNALSTLPRKILWNVARGL
jgi:hypothetical protein